MWGRRQDIQQKLERLYPGESCEKKYKEYCFAQKRMIFTAIIIGIVTGAFSLLSEKLSSDLQKDGSLLRNEWGKGAYEVTLVAKIGEEEETITYVIEERQYTEKELLALSKSAVDKLKKEMKNQNESLSYVTSNLNLPIHLSGYPFTVTWKSSDYKKLRSDGRINPEEIAVPGEKIILTATLVYHEWKYSEEIVLMLYPKQLSEKEKRKEELLLLISESDIQSRQKSKFILPTMLGEDIILWRESLKGNPGSFMILGVISAIAFILGMNRDLDKRDLKRKKELSYMYPEFVSSLQLYLGAGLSLRNAFSKMSKEYQRAREQGEKKRYLYEEIVISCNHLVNGMQEADVYRKWAERCDEPHYRKLGYLLISYNRQGNRDIVKLLGKEAYAAWEERRLSARRQGEEAGTKLLFPMVLMLAVVMGVIMLPVYVSF